VGAQWWGPSGGGPVVGVPLWSCPLPAWLLQRPCTVCAAGLCLCSWFVPVQLICASRCAHCWCAHTPPARLLQRPRTVCACAAGLCGQVCPLLVCPHSPHSCSLCSHPQALRINPGVRAPMAAPLSPATAKVGPLLLLLLHLLQFAAEAVKAAARRRLLTRTVSGWALPAAAVRGGT